MEGGPKPTDGLAMASPVTAVGADPGPGSSSDPAASGDSHAEVPAAEAGQALSAGGQDSQGRSLLIRIQDWLFGYDFVGVIIAGFLGGLVLNLMPCVLPVISLKVLSFVRQAHEERWRIFRLGLVYSSGIMVFFLFLAVVFYAWGTGWGELFQNPIFVIIMAAIVLAFSLSLFGVFAVFTPRVVSELGQKAEAQEGYLSAFGTGLLATLLGTACTAPFLSAAIGYAVGLPMAQGVSIFLAAGLGMASPFVILTYNPSWLRFVPRPGPWIGVFEALMGFVLMGTVIWLVNPLRVQLGAYGLLLALIFLLAVAIAVWIKGRIEFGAPLGKKVRLYAIAAAVVAGGWLLPFRAMSTVPELIAEQIEHHDLRARGLRDKYGKNLDWSKGIPWQPYVRELAMDDVRAGYTVFVDYTATWCASCKSNLKAFIERPEVIEVMRELNVLPYEADYTLRNPEIKKDLDRYGRAGVPMYLVYRPGDAESPEVLPEFLTKQTIIDALRRAGPTRVKVADSGGKSPAARKEY
jgi:thiol:disulfide interchange protein DsbD